MNPERWQEVRRLFEAVRALPAEARGSYLDAHDGGDAAMRAEVESLLEHDDAGADFIATPALGPGFAISDPLGEEDAPPMPDSRLGARVGRYELMRCIGRGGMGAVYEAQQMTPRRLVALKVVEAIGPGDERASHRFQREAESLGRLRHPAIATIYEAGRSPEGHHFVAMELVRGLELMTWVAERRPDRPTRLDLFEKVCAAVHSAHRRGVIHRDLKPSNIMVDEDDGPKVLDFGLARLTDADVSAATLETEVGRIMGTLPYMSPEQTRGNPNDIDTRSDVYALGVTLYELLTERMPYDVPAANVPRAIDIICRTPPRRPSSLDRSLRGDLETIVLKALDKDPERRYESAAALGEDVRRYLTDQPILGRPPSTLYQLRKLVKRHTVPAVLLAILFVVSVVFGVVGTIQASRLRSAKITAEMESEAPARENYSLKISQARTAYEVPNLAQFRAVLAACAEERRGWEHWWLASLADQADLTLAHGGAPVHAVGVSRDRILLVTGELDETLRVWDAVGETELYALDDHAAGVSTVRFSPDGTLLASGDPEGRLVIRDAATGRVRAVLDAHADGVADHVFSADGTRLVSIGGRPADPFGDMDSRTRLRVWDTADGKQLREIEGVRVSLSIALAPDGRRALTGTLDTVVEVWDLAIGARVARASLPRMCTAMAWHADGAHVLVACGTRIEVLDPARGERVRFHDHEAGVHAIIVDSEGRYAASADSGGTLKVVTLEGHEDVLELPVSVHPRWQPRFLPGGAWLAVWGFEGRASFFRMSTFEMEPAAPDERREAVANWEDRFVVAARSDFDLDLVDLGAGGTARRLVGHGAPVRRAAFGADGRTLVTADEAGLVMRWDVDRETPSLTFSVSDSVTAVAWRNAAPGGQTGREIVTAHASGAVRCWDAKSGALRAERAVSGAAISCLAVAGEDGRILCGDAAGRTALLDGRGQVTWSATGHRGVVRAVAFHPDGRRVIAGGEDGQVLIWRPGTHSAAPLVVFRHERPVRSIACTPDQGRVVTAAEDGSVRLWHADVGLQELLALRWRNRHVASVSVSRDGTRIIGRSFAGGIKVWEVRRDRSRAAALRSIMAGAAAAAAE